MRTIKFRGKRLDNGEWIYGDLLHTSGSKLEIHWLREEKDGDLNPWWATVDPETVGQLVISKDYEYNELNQDIYEGDIIRNWATYGSKGVIYVVSFEVTDMEQGYRLELDDWGAKIIGNIHDNPELLKTE